jgi:hypothetical protein
MNPIPTAEKVRPASPPINGAAREVSRMCVAAFLGVLVTQGVLPASVTAGMSEPLQIFLASAILMPALTFLGKVARTAASESGFLGKLIGKLL